MEICKVCLNEFRPQWIRDNMCNGCRRPDLVVEAVTTPDRRPDNRWATVKDIYNAAIAPLTLKQFEKVMGGNMSYYFKFEAIKRVTRNRKVIELCDKGMQLITEINAAKHGGVNI